MVRVNLVDPSVLTDQHLVAEYDEILMLLGYVRRYPSREGIPSSYRLGKGHILFFKDKLVYLKRRHGLLKTEMRKRGFRPTRTITLNEFPKSLRNDWTPREKDYEIIKTRLREKLEKKPAYYRYYGKHESEAFLRGLLDEPPRAKARGIC